MSGQRTATSCSIGEVVAKSSTGRQNTVAIVECIRENTAVDGNRGDFGTWGPSPFGSCVDSFRVVQIRLRHGSRQ